VKLSYYNYKNNYITKYREEVREEYNEEIKKLSNFYSVEPTIRMLKDYKKKYSYRRNIYY